MQAVIIDIDPFDLPEWLGTHDVVWRADAGLRTGHLVRGRLTAGDDPTEALGLDCDLLAVDEAYPAPVVDDATRLRVHQSWRHGQVVIGNLDDGLDSGLGNDALLRSRGIDRVGTAGDQRDSEAEGGDGEQRERGTTHGVACLGSGETLRVIRSAGPLCVPGRRYDVSPSH